MNQTDKAHASGADILGSLVLTVLKEELHEIVVQDFMREVLLRSAVVRKLVLRGRT